jgi:hypothetical protein
VSFSKQLEAIGSALLLIQKLPAHAVWALECTNDDDAESPSVLNIFAEEDQWAGIALSLRLGKPVDRNTSDRGEQFVSYRQGTLHISLIQREET